LEFREHRLENGLQIIAECNDQACSLALGYFVRTGARDETPEISGVSHFLEHMAFKGTPRRSAADVNRELDELGAHSNAFTSEEQTVFYANVLPEYQAPTMDLLSDIMRPSLRPDDFETEKQVIIEEIFKYEDQPPFGAHEKCMAAYFGGHPLGQSVLGTVETVSSLTPEAMQDYFHHRYAPNNMVLVATGRVDFPALVAQARQHCGPWPQVDAGRDVSVATAHTGSHQFTKEEATQQYAVQMSSGPSATDPQRFAARVLATILGDDSGSRYYWDLVDSGLAEYAGLGAYEFDGTGVLMGYMCCAPSQLRDNLARIEHIQGEISLHGTTATELELAQSKICSHVVRQSERPGNRLFSVGNAWLQRHQYRTVQQTVRAYQQVSRDQIMAVLADFPLAENTVVSIGPLR
jgi:predicted Zn-dependent peptidase